MKYSELDETLINRLSRVSDSLLEEFPQHSAYIELQQTWNKSVLSYLSRWLRKDARVVSIGSFLGAPEIVLSDYVSEIVCCDIDDFLPAVRPSNMTFCKIDLDKPASVFPEGHFDVCICVEVLEHLRWSPLPLIRWMRKHCNLLVISTPDDREWPNVVDAPWTTTSHFSKIPFADINAEGNPEPMSHCKQYTQQEFVELLDINGFRLVELQRVGEGGHQMLAIAAAREGFVPADS